MKSRSIKTVLLTALVLLGACKAKQVRGGVIPGKASVTGKSFGTAPDGQPVTIYTLTNSSGMEVRIMNYGGVIVSLKVPDRNGVLDDVVLGYDSLAGYLRNSPYFGAIVGRYANRIARGRFTANGRAYQLALNNGPNALHGGVRGFDKVVWTAVPIPPTDTGGVGLRLTYVSPDGEEGYPGTVHVTVTYSLKGANELSITYEAMSDLETPINLTNHTYFNLAGAGNGDILGTRLAINADHYTPVDSTLIPTGAIAPVAGTPFDFRHDTTIGARIDLPDQQLHNGGGYDHNFVLNKSGVDTGSWAARVVEPTTGRMLTVRTTEPGVQFYTGNFLDGTITGKGGRVYQKRAGFCLETQHFPDSPNHPNFPPAVVRPGGDFRSQTLFSFRIAE